jgi:membrane fusion protein (multidrug efflux system)
LLERKTRAAETRATPQAEVDRARAELDVAKARIARTKAIIDRKTIRAPFRARVGISDVHDGQYLHEGTLLTTLQGVDQATHIDFSVAQHIAQGLKPGDAVEVLVAANQPPVAAQIVALDALVDPATRNTSVRARVNDSRLVPGPGASVRVRVPASAPIQAVGIPVSALRRGPAGDHVFVLTPDDKGLARVQTRRVKAGVPVGDEVLLLSGVTPGERVATEGSFKLREGALVSVARTNVLTAAR